MENPGKSATMLKVMRDRWETAAKTAIDKHNHKQAIIMLLKAHKLNRELEVKINNECGGP